MTNEFNETLQYIRKQYSESPEVGIVLGTGMGDLVHSIAIEKQIAYNFIPHFPISTVESHFGKLIFGKIDGVRVVAMQGRMHYYEGYSMFSITYPIRVMKMLGIKTLLLSNAAGALNPSYQKGDLMIIEDHINLQPENPLRGENLDFLGSRFPDMSQPYHAELITRAESIAQESGFAIHKGVYVAVQGPNLETRSEYRYLRMIGGDVVGMSTVPEVIVANHAGLKTFAISVVTDICNPEHLNPVSVEEIIAVAKNAEPKLSQLLKKLVISCA